MTVIVHISDLHFGRDNEALTGPLLDAINGIHPDMVALSGDLTQRARKAQFARARAFIDGIAAPVVSVPGNHDVPLDNLLVRFIRPFSRYRKAISPELEPRWDGPGATVLGLNSVNPYAWQSGRLGKRALRRVQQGFAGTNPAHTRVVVMHHPLTLPAGSGKRPLRGARRATAQFAACGADLVLCGHLHGWRAEPVRDADTGAGALLVQAGTGLSTRLRGEQNDFNRIELHRTGATITRYTASGDVFRPLSTHDFRQTGACWQAA